MINCIFFAGWRQSLRRSDPRKNRGSRDGLADSGTTLTEHGEYSIEGQHHYRARFPLDPPTSRNLRLERHLNLPGKPDFIFRSERLAIFLDGCFWHGCPRCYRPPQDNRSYWKKKLIGNRRRDRRRSRELRLLGWRVLRIWEHTLKSRRGRSRILEKVAAALKERAPRPAR
jgi:DNA mismatch endonuclease (patch repair protein)